jgi:hypothetical protein
MIAKGNNIPASVPIIPETVRFEAYRRVSKWNVFKKKLLRNKKFEEGKNRNQNYKHFR